MRAAQEALVDERLEHPQVSPGDRFYRVDVETAGEDGQASEELLLFVV